MSDKLPDMDSYDQPLVITSCMADNEDFLMADLAGYLTERLGQRVEFLSEVSWREREAKLDQGQAHVGWICGLPYVWRADRPESGLELLAAPVVRGAAYGGRPVYFSDVLVRSDRPVERLEDLAGRVWAYNEPGSHSGYSVMKARLAELNWGGRFFREAVMSGSHQQSLRMLLDGRADVSAIDTIVMEIELENHPELRGAFRAVERLGPSPIPPLVVRRELSADLKRALKQSVLSMHEDPAGAAVLARGPVDRYVEVRDEDYDPIRRAFRAGESVPI